MGKYKFRDLKKVAQNHLGLISRRLVTSWHSMFPSLILGQKRVGGLWTKVSVVEKGRQSVLVSVLQRNRAKRMCKYI
jgi:hypothetical protein